MLKLLSYLFFNLKYLKKYLVLFLVSDAGFETIFCTKISLFKLKFFIDSFSCKFKLSLFVFCFVDLRNNNDFSKLCEDN